jgi:hypothetical protein
MKKIRLLSSTFLLALTYIIFISSSGGRATQVNDDRTNAPGSNGKCEDCHSGGSYGIVILSIQIFNQGTTTPVTSYTGGTTYDMSVTVTKSSGGTAKYGFQLTSLTSPGNSPVANTYTNLETNVQQKLITATGRRFVEQTQAV